MLTRWALNIALLTHLSFFHYRNLTEAQRKSKLVVDYITIKTKRKFKIMKQKLNKYLVIFNKIAVCLSFVILYNLVLVFDSEKPYVTNV